MQQEVLDNNFAPQPTNEANVIYGKFWPRTGALIIDGLIIGLPLFAITYLNISWKSIPLLVLPSLVSMLYRPTMEYLYGASLGKMALGLKVVGQDYQSPTLEAILLRNIFSLGSGSLSVIFSVLLFMSPEFQDVTGLMEYAALQEGRPERYLQWVFNAITVVEIIFLLSDDRCRALHDRIGKTYVIAK